MPLSGQAYAVKALTNTTPATAINITAKYKGTLGNSLTVTVRDHPTEAGIDQLLLYLSGTLVETYNYAQTDITDLVAQINDGSDYITAAVAVTGVALTAVTASAFASGADGTAVGSDYTDAMEAFEAQPFDIFTVPDMTDSGILASLRAWNEEMNGSARRFILVTGGGDSESMSTAVTRSQLSDDNENIVNVGMNMFTDPDGAARRTSEVVGHVAGMIAAAGPRRSVTFATMPDGWQLTAAPSRDEIEVAIDGGVLCFSQNANGVRVEVARTTYTVTTDDNKPYDTFSKIKYVRTIHAIENQFTQVTEEMYIGKVPNTPEGRSNYAGSMLGLLRTLEGENVLKKGTSHFRLDATQDNTGEVLYPIWGTEFTSAIERVLSIGNVSA
jgi:phage tail sheath gpL-like